MTDLISQQPEEILIKIFNYIGYQSNLYYVSSRFRNITQIIDYNNIHHYLININNSSIDLLINSSSLLIITVYRVKNISIFK